MKLSASLKAFILTAAAGLAACTSLNTEPEGPTLVSFDHGALDTLVALGQQDRVLAVPAAGLPDYLSNVAAGLPDAGTLKQPDMDVLREVQPDLILVSGRQASLIPELARIAPVRNVSLAEGSYRESVEGRVLELAALYGQQVLAKERLNELWRHMEQRRSELPADVKVVVVTHNAGRFSLRQEPVVSELLRLRMPAIPETVEPVTRDNRTFYPVTPEDLAAMAPDVVLVVDRSAAIGQPPLAPETLRTGLDEAGAADTAIRMLDPALWYLSGGGLQSLRLQVDEVADAVATSSRNRG